MNLVGFRGQTVAKQEALILIASMQHDRKEPDGASHKLKPRGVRLRFSRFVAVFRHLYKVSRLQPVSYKRVPCLLPVRYADMKSVRLETAVCGDQLAGNFGRYFWTYMF